VYALLGLSSRLQAIYIAGAEGERAATSAIYTGGQGKEGACGAHNHVPTSRHRAIRIGWKPPLATVS
jgi:hypothetical protein